MGELTRVLGLVENSDTDAALAKLEEGLAAGNEAGAGFLAAQTGENTSENVVSSGAAIEREGSVIDKYKLLQPIGEGGFGVVYMAEQLKPVKRRVALKIIKPGMDSKQVVARFEAERQALALMDHPNIAKVHDAGETASGRPFFVMELVKGVPITEFCDERNLSTAERLELFVDVCHAVQHAHQKGVIHRDLKPSNVMVTLHDDKAVVKVIDFGVAKATQTELTDKTLFTMFEQFIGTPAYMSPEQAQMSGLDIDTRSDIYSLGVLLYELLTGRTPFDQKQLLRAGYDEMRRVIREEEPPKPSTRMSTLADAELTDLANHRGSEPRKLRALMRGDLDWIVMKALEKDRTRRYDTANGLAMDVRRHLADEPVVAAAPSAGYRIAKYVRRHRGPVMTAIALVVLLVAGVTVSSWQWYWRAQSEGKERAAKEALAHELSAKMEAQKLVQEKTALAETRLTKMKDAEGRRLYEGGDHFAAIRSFAEGLALLQSGSSGSPLEPLHRLRLSAALEHTPRLAQLWSAGGSINHAHLSPDGRRIVTAVTLPSGEGEVRVWDVASGRSLTKPMLHQKAVLFVQFCPGEGEMIVTASEDTTARLWDASTGDPLCPPMRHPQIVTQARFSADGNYVITASPAPDHLSSGGYAIWETKGGKEVRRVETVGFTTIFVCFDPLLRPSIFSTDRGVPLFLVSGKQQDLTYGIVTDASAKYILETQRGVREIEFSSDGARRLTTGSFGHTMKSGTRVTSYGGQSLSFAPILEHKGTIADAALSPEGNWVATASHDQTARVWDATTGVPIGPPLRHRNGVESIEFSPDGRQVLTTDRDGFVRVWDARSGSPASPWLPHGGGISLAGFLPDGSRIVTTCDDGQVRVWDLRGMAPRFSLAHDAEIAVVSHAAATQRILTVTRGGAARLWNGESGESKELASELGSGIGRGRMSPDGQSFLTVNRIGVVQLWDASSGEPIGTALEHGDPVSEAIFSPGGEKIITSSLDQAFVWDTFTGKRSGSPIQHRHLINDIGLSPDGSLIATAGQDQMAAVWSASDGSPVFEPFKHSEAVAWVRFVDGRGRLLTVTTNGTGQLWDLATGQKEGPPMPHGSSVTSVKVNSTGKIIAMAGVDLTVSVWNGRSGKAMISPLLHHGSVEDLSIHPSLPLLATATHEGFVTLWDLREGEQVLAAFRHSGPITHLRFIDDGRAILTASDDKTVAVWDLEGSAKWTSADVLDFFRDPLGETGGSQGSQTVEERWKQIHARYGDNFFVAPTRDDAWGSRHDLVAMAWDVREAKSAFGDGDWKRAIRFLDSVIGQVGEEPGLFELRAWALMYDKQPRKALADFALAIGREPGRKWPRLGAYLSHCMIGEQPAAEAAFLELMRPIAIGSDYFFTPVMPHWSSPDPSEAAEWLGLQQRLSQWKALEFDSATLRAVEAIAHLMHGRAEEARTMFESLLEERPEALEFREAIYRLDAADGSWTAVLDETSRILTQHPDDANARFYRGAALMKLKRWEEARPALSSAASAQPDNLLFHLRIAELYRTAGFFEGAAEAYEGAVRIAPHEHVLWFRGATLQWEAGRPERFREFCHEMITRFGDAGFGNQGDLQTAERVAKRCLQLPPENLLPGDFDAALVLADRSYASIGRTISSLDGALRLVGGMASYRRGRFDETLARLNPSEDDLPGHFRGDQTLFLAMALQRLGRTAEVAGIVEEIAARAISNFGPGGTPASRAKFSSLSLLALSEELEEILLGSLVETIRISRTADPHTLRSVVLLAEAWSQCEPSDRFHVRASDLCWRFLEALATAPQDAEIAAIRESVIWSWMRSRGRWLGSEVPRLEQAGDLQGVLAACSAEIIGEIVGEGDGDGAPAPGRCLAPAHMALLAVRPKLAAEPIELIPTGTRWRFWDRGPNLSSGWFEPGFDASAWGEGAGELGFGDGDEKTELERIAPGGGAPQISFFFRHRFVVPDSLGDDRPLLRLQLKRDDGAIVYLNGREILRSNVPAGPVTAKTLASRSIFGDGEAQFHESMLKSDALAAGENLIAVAVYQNRLQSSDISFDLSLSAESSIADLLAGLPTEAIDRGLRKLISILPEAEQAGWENKLRLAIARSTDR